MPRQPLAKILVVEPGKALQRGGNPVPGQALQHEEGEGNGLEENVSPVRRLQARCRVRGGGLRGAAGARQPFQERGDARARCGVEVRAHGDSLARLEGRAELPPHRPEQVEAVAEQLAALVQRAARRGLEVIIELRNVREDGANLSDEAHPQLGDAHLGQRRT